MTQKKLRLIVSTVIFLVFLGIQLYKQYTPTKSILSTASKVTPPVVLTHPFDQTFYKVSKVVDGDTINVLVDNKKETVRILGINTPETVDPRKPVQCFGKEASNMAKTILTGQSVRLESDPTQGDKDKYERLLRYVLLPDNTDFGLKMIEAGYAYEYTYDTPYKFQTIYKQAQKKAEAGSVGLWSTTTCSGNL